MRVEVARYKRIAEEVRDAELMKNPRQAVAALAEEKEARVLEAGGRPRHCRTRAGGGRGPSFVQGPSLPPLFGRRKSGGLADTADTGKSRDVAGLFLMLQFGPNLAKSFLLVSTDTPRVLAGWD